MRAALRRRRTKVSVLMAVRDCEHYIAEALTSVLQGSHDDLDLIVVDDGSTDATAAVAERFGPPVHVVRQPPRGIARARNRGVELAVGDYLAFLDGDDLWPRDRIARQLRQFVVDPSLDLVFGSERRFRTGERAQPPRPARMATTMLVRRTAWDRVGPFAEDHTIGEFLDWLCRARDAGLREAGVRETALLRREHDANTTRGGDLTAYARILKTALDRRRARGAEA
jgi:glycosyltransferase involved in cell wall biosynthesis